MEIRYTPKMRDLLPLGVLTRRMPVGEPHVFWTILCVTAFGVIAIAKLDTDMAWQHGGLDRHLLWKSVSMNLLETMFFIPIGGFCGVFFAWLTSLFKYSYSVSICPAEFRHSSPGYEFALDWTKIRAVFNEGQTILFYPKNPFVSSGDKRSALTSRYMSVIIVPKSVFENDAEAERFAQNAHNYWYHAKNGLPISPVNPEDIWPPAPEGMES